MLELAFEESLALARFDSALPLCVCWYCCWYCCMLKQIKELIWIISSLAKKMIIVSLHQFAKVVHRLATQTVVRAHQTVWCRGGSKYW